MDCLSPVCAERLAFRGATAGASKCKAPPPSMVAATTKDYVCIWKDKQCVCRNGGTYAKNHFSGMWIISNMGNTTKEFQSATVQKRA